MTGKDYGTARAFLLRAGDLEPAGRYDLARQVAEAVASRVQPKPPLGVPPEAFLLCVASVYQHRQARQAAVPAYAPPAVVHGTPPITTSVRNDGQEGDFTPLA
jgi:hypothetical protein